MLPCRQGISGFLSGISELGNQISLYPAQKTSFFESKVVIFSLIEKKERKNNLKLRVRIKGIYYNASNVFKSLMIT